MMIYPNIPRHVLEHIAKDKGHNTTLDTFLELFQEATQALIVEGNLDDSDLMKLATLFKYMEDIAEVHMEPSN